MNRSLYLLLAALLLVAGCSPASDGSSGSVGTSDETSQPTAMTENEAATEAQSETTTSAPPFDESVVGDEPGTAGDDGIYRLAESGSTPAGMLLWDPAEVRRQDTNGGWVPLAEGRFSEVVDVPDRGIAFQLENDESTIWMKADDGPAVEIVVGTDEQALQLEGAGHNAAGQVVVFYQRHVGSTPPTRSSTLRTFNLDTQEVQELVETGGWESGTDFSQVTGSVVVGNWGAGAGALSGSILIDVTDGSEVDYWEASGASSQESACDCPAYRQAVIIDGTIYGIRAQADPVTGVTKAYGLFTYDLSNKTEQVLASFPWDSGLWYPEDLFELDGHLVASIKDGEGLPLPSLVWHLDDATAWTLPEPGFARPAADR